MTEELVQNPGKAVLSIQNLSDLCWMFFRHRTAAIVHRHILFLILASRPSLTLPCIHYKSKDSKLLILAFEQNVDIINVGGSTF